MILRPFKPADYDAWKALYADYAKPWGESVDEARLKKVWAIVCGEDTGAHGFVCEEAGRLLAFAQYIVFPCTYSTSLTCYLQDLYVAPPARRQGLAQRLIEHVVEIGKKEGWRNVHWKTMPDNQAAIALYGKMAKKSSRIHFEIECSSNR